EGDDMLRAVRQDERDAIPGLHPETPQTLCGVLDLLAELGVARLAPEELEGDVARVGGDRLGDEVAERARRHLELSGYTVGVGVEPWLLGGRPRHSGSLRRRVTSRAVP